MEPASPEAILLQGGEDKGEAVEEDECEKEDWLFRGPKKRLSLLSLSNLGRR
jgi:hypothetical protein